MTWGKFWLNNTQKDFTNTAFCPVERNLWHKSKKTLLVYIAAIFHLEALVMEFLTAFGLVLSPGQTSISYRVSIHQWEWQRLHSSFDLVKSLPQYRLPRVCKSSDYIIHCVASWLTPSGGVLVNWKLLFVAGKYQSGRCWCQHVVLGEYLLLISIHTHFSSTSSTTLLYTQSNLPITTTVQQGRWFFKGGSSQSGYVI